MTRIAMVFPIALLLCLFVVSAVQARQAALNYRLIQAVKSNNLAAAKGALDAGADATTRDTGEKGGSIWQNLALTIKLWEQDAHSVPRNPGPTALHLAAGRIDTEMGRLLLARGAKVDAKDDRRQTPLTCLVERVFWRYDLGGDGPLLPPYIPFIKLLLDNGADVNSRNKDDMIPLYRAVLIGDEDLVSLLIARGANVNFKLDVGFTPLGVARDRKYNKIAEVLRQAGAVQ